MDIKTELYVTKNIKVTLLLKEPLYVRMGILDLYKV